MGAYHLPASTRGDAGQVTHSVTGTQQCSWPVRFGAPRCLTPAGWLACGPGTGSPASLEQSSRSPRTPSPAAKRAGPLKTRDDQVARRFTVTRAIRPRGNSKSRSRFCSLRCQRNESTSRSVCSFVLLTKAPSDSAGLCVNTGLVLRVGKLSSCQRQPNPDPWRYRWRWPARGRRWCTPSAPRSWLV